MSSCSNRCFLNHLSYFFSVLRISVVPSKRSMYMITNCMPILHFTEGSRRTVMPREAIGFVEGRLRTLP
jgi:hypothetical protein